MRCEFCNKKIIYEFECKCFKKLCITCLPYYKHNCLFDYKTHHKQTLSDQNPQIIPPKVTLM